MIRVEPLAFVHVGGDARRRAHIAASEGVAWCGREGRRSRGHEGCVPCVECLLAVRQVALDQMRLDFQFSPVVQ